MGDLLIKGGIILTMDESRVLNDHAIAVRNGVIEKIEPASHFDESEFKEVIDAGSRVVTPGWINVHMHFYSSLVVGLNKAKPASNFVEILENLWWRLDKKLTLEDCYFSALAACIQCIRHGTTTIIDHHSSPYALTGSLKTIAKAVEKSGLRASLCYEVSDREGTGIARQGIEENIEFIQYAQKRSDHRLKALFGLHASFTISNQTLRKARNAAEAGVGFHIHAAEDLADQNQCLEKHGMRVIQRLDRAGVLGPQTICAHCVHLNEAEMELLVKTRSIVTHQPQSNLNNAVGVMNMPEFLKAGILTGLGTDAMTCNMLEELRSCLWIRKWIDRNPSSGFMETVQLLVNNNPAIAARFWPNAPGVLKPGRPADILIYDYTPHTPLHEGNMAGHLVFGLSQTKVNTTIAGGRILMRDGVLTVLEEAAIMAEANERAASLWKRF